MANIRAAAPARSQGAAVTPGGNASTLPVAGAKHKGGPGETAATRHLHRIGLRSFSSRFNV